MPQNPSRDNPNFRNWFAGSAATDSSGSPMKLYHGTQGDFSTFANDKIGAENPYSFGFHLTSRPGEASAYADSVGNLAEKFNPNSKFAKPVRSGANVMPVYAAVRNPLILHTEYPSASMEADLEKGKIIHRLYEAKKSGNPYDGVIIHRRRGDEHDHSNVIVFDPRQIKSAVGNNGNFDPSDPRITRATGGPSLNTPIGNTGISIDPSKAARTALLVAQGMGRKTLDSGGNAGLKNAINSFSQQRNAEFNTSPASAQQEQMLLASLMNQPRELAVAEAPRESQQPPAMNTYGDLGDQIERGAKFLEGTPDEDTAPVKGQPTKGAVVNAATGSPSGNHFLNALSTIESNNQNIFSKVDPDVAGPFSRSQGYYQIDKPTWELFAPKAGVDLKQYPRAMLAPSDVQASVVRQIPVGRFGPRTQRMLRQQFGPLDPERTVGDYASPFDARSNANGNSNVDPYSYLSTLSQHPDRSGDTSNLNPQFANRLASAIKQARDEGLPVGMMSGFREPSVTGSAYDAAGNSSHSYGLASDIYGLDGPNGQITKRWAQIAGANGLHNPYGIGDEREFNHWQLPEVPLEQTPDVLKKLKEAYGTGDFHNVWSAYGGQNAPSEASVQAVQSADTSGYAPPSMGRPDTQGIIKDPNSDGSFTLRDPNGNTVGYDRGNAPLDSVPYSQPHIASPNSGPPLPPPRPPDPSPQGAGASGGPQAQAQPMSDQSNLYDNPNAAPSAARGGYMRRAGGGPAYSSMPTDELIAKALDIIRRRHAATGGTQAAPTLQSLQSNYNTLSQQQAQEQAQEQRVNDQLRMQATNQMINIEQNGGRGGLQAPNGEDPLGMLGATIGGGPPPPSPSAPTPVQAAPNTPAVPSGQVGNQGTPTGNGINTPPAGNDIANYGANPSPIPMAAPTPYTGTYYNNTLDQVLGTNNPTQNQIFGFNYPQNLPPPKAQPVGPVSQNEINGLYGFGGGSQMGTGTFESGGAVIMDALNRARKASKGKR